MKNKSLTILALALAVAAVAIWKINQKEPSRVEIPSVELEQNQVEEKSTIPIKQIEATKIANAPHDKEFAELSSNRLVNFRMAGDKILMGNRVLWSDEKEYVSFVQESPDSSMLIFFKQREGKYVIYRNNHGELQKLDIDIPSQIHGNRQDGWYWVGNDHLINEQIEDFEPAPRGYGNEGWIKGNKIYVFDLSNHTHSEMSLVQIPLPEEEDILLKDESDSSYSYKIPIMRYYRIKGITDDGVIFLKSVDTSEPLGGNARDEGAFVLKK